MTATFAADQKLETMVRSIESRPDAAALFRSLAEAHWRAGDLDGYAAFFRRAFVLSPSARILSGVHRSSFDKDNVLELRDRARALIDRGVNYAAVISELAIAEALLGNGKAVRYLLDYERFFQRSVIELPEGRSIESFNSALKEEIKSNLKFYGSPASLAIRRAWRYNAIANAETPIMRTLVDVLGRHLSRYAASLPQDTQHPFIAARPAQSKFGGWAVVSNGAGHHKPHLHGRSWVTGVYYIAEPETARAPGSDRGWLRVGPPRELAGAADHDWELRLIEPVPGSLVLMPAYFWHWTEAMGVDQERICVAFELKPAELAEEVEPQDD